MAGLRAESRTPISPLVVEVRLETAEMERTRLVRVGVEQHPRAVLQQPKLERATSVLPRDCNTRVDVGVVPLRLALRQGAVAAVDITAVVVGRPTAQEQMAVVVAVRVTSTRHAAQLGTQKQRRWVVKRSTHRFLAGVQAISMWQVLLLVDRAM